MDTKHLVAERPAEGLRLSQVHAFYREVLGLPGSAPQPDDDYRGRGRAALASGELIGLFTGGLMPGNDDPERHLFLYLYGAVHPSWRRQGIGRRLLAGLIEDIRSEGRPVTLMATLDRSPEEAAAGFLLRQGFDEVPGSVRYELDLSWASAAQIESSQSISIYRGGNAEVESAIVDLYRRAYRGRAAIPQLTIDSVRHQLDVPGFAYVLAFDGERLIGHAAIYVHDAECYVDSIVVVRTHWGSGISDALGHAITRHALAEGCSRIACVAEITNRASRALIERQGYSLTGQLRRFRRVVSDGCDDGLRRGCGST